MAHSWHSLVSHRRSDPPYSELMQPPRPEWNDKRMDEFAKRTEDNFREVRREVRGVETGVRDEMNERFAKLEATFNRRFDILFGALATGFIAAVVQHFVG